MLPSLVLAALVSLQNCAINTGLDPACPLTSAGVTQSSDVRTSTATQHTDTLFATYDVHADQQIDVSMPFYDRLGIAGVGDAYGLGDLSAGYSWVAIRRKRIAHVVGLSASFATGAPTFSAGRTQLEPMYAASYALGKRISLVGILRYAFPLGGTTLPYAPREQRVSFVPRAIVDLTRSGLYLAADVDGQSITGGERYQAYAADGVLGIATARYAFSVNYQEPIAFYTYHQVFHHALLWKFSWRVPSK